MTTTNTSPSKNQGSRTVEFELVDWQMEVHEVQANETILMIGRGGGKTVGGISPWMVRVAEAMPGHLSGIFGQTYAHLDKNIMPKIFLGFEQLGYQKGVDYVIGKPPEGWPRCLYPLKDFSRTITWRNGTTWQQISLEVRGSANAFDFQSGIFDEAKYMSELQLDDEVLPTFRGFSSLFGHLPDYLAKIYATDKLMDYVKIKWLLDKRKLVDKVAVQTVIDIQREINKLEYAIGQTNFTNGIKLARVIALLEAKAAGIRKNLVYVAEASARSNIKNLGAAWWADKKRKMKPYAFSIAVENNDPIQGQECFYPGLTPEHEYEELYPNWDCNPRLPLIITSDYQHSIAPICVAQIATLPGRQKPSLNYINEFYALYPFGHNEAIDAFCAYYAAHGVRTVIYAYDHTAIGKRPSASPIYEVIIERFRKNKWNVQAVYLGLAPAHFDKYKGINKRLREQGSWYSIFFNKTKCIWTLTSIKASNTILSNGETKKDKEYEHTKRHPDVDQRATTHFSDTADQLEWGVNEQKLIRPATSSGGGGIGMR